MKKGLIIASGNIGDLAMLEEEIKEHDYIICADGGVKHIYGMQINIDAVIGDLDSVDESFPEYVSEKNIAIIEFPIEKDETDTELAVDYLIEEGYGYITLVGVIGSRMDHTFANILLLKRLALKNVKGKIIDGNNTIFFANSYIRLKRKKNHYVSIIPISTSGVTVSLKGFYYPLENSHIEYGTTLGISNKIVEDIGEIHISKGEALIFHSRD